MGCVASRRLASAQRLDEPIDGRATSAGETTKTRRLCGNREREVGEALHNGDGVVVKDRRNILAGKLIRGIRDKQTSLANRSVSDDDTPATETTSQPELARSYHTRATSQRGEECLKRT